MSIRQLLRKIRGHEKRADSLLDPSMITRAVLHRIWSEMKDNAREAAPKEQLNKLLAGVYLTLMQDPATRYPIEPVVWVDPVTGEKSIRYTVSHADPLIRPALHPDSAKRELQRALWEAINYQFYYLPDTVKLLHEGAKEAFKQPWEKELEQAIEKMNNLVRLSPLVTGAGTVATTYAPYITPEEMTVLPQELAREIMDRRLSGKKLYEWIKNHPDPRVRRWYRDLVNTGTKGLEFLLSHSPMAKYIPLSRYVLTVLTPGNLTYGKFAYELAKEMVRNKGLAAAAMDLISMGMALPERLSDEELRAINKAISKNKRIVVDLARWRDPYSTEVRSMLARQIAKMLAFLNPKLKETIRNEPLLEQMIKMQYGGDPQVMLYRALMEGALRYMDPKLRKDLLKGKLIFDPQFRNMWREYYRSRQLQQALDRYAEKVWKETGIDPRSIKLVIPEAGR